MPSRLCGEISYPESLPITARRAEIVATLQRHQVLVLAGETGSGKTTQIPKMCLDAGFGRRGWIGCTQPRRVAAQSVSRRIADELGVGWGEEVGCKIRFADRTGPRTVVKMMTDGILLAEVQSDPLLRHYEVLIIDEAHERSLNIDFLLGYLRQLVRRRRDLKVVITSATIDTAAFAKAFDDAPIIEVSGRTYPVEVIYRPLEDLLHERAAEGEESFVEGVALAVQEVCEHWREGDILVFLPGEREIREARKLLEGRQLGRAEILPLFGRLASAEQDRIFAPAQRRKVILSTNLAETSLTIPGIRFVIDTGLARVPRYQPNSRTQRLPVEKIARSSADQRKGRCGRVQDGVCVRLYSPEDFERRPPFPTPEIQRSNLAAVILRMLAYGLGDPTTFPFIDPPQSRAVTGGFALLRELGAIDEDRQMTDLGRELASLPVDPTVGRMLLQARREGCVPEVLVIGAGLSIQDPRERPMEKAEEADRMHRKFVHPESDFLTLLNLWTAYHEAVEQMTQRQLRRYCEEHFVNYQRMREWRDLHDQLEQALGDLGDWQQGLAAAEYHQIHRAVLAGLVGQVAHREEGNHYLATHSRKVMLFPGSGLFKKSEAKAKPPADGPKDKPKVRAPEWIVAAEFMETGRLYARAAARVDPGWILEFGEHLIKKTVTAPAWDPQAGRVYAREHHLLYGLEIEVKSIGYEKIDPPAATEIFIRDGLVPHDFQAVVPVLEHNRQVRETVEEWQTRQRRPADHGLDERLAAWYAARVPAGVASIVDLRKLVRQRHDAGEPNFLRLREADLANVEAAPDPTLFPDALEVNGHRVRLSYAYQPGAEEDGATVQVPVQALQQLDPALLDWAVPGFLREKVETLMRALPKERRRELFPIGEKTEALLAALRPSPLPLTEALSRLIWEKFRVRVGPADWNLDELPAHLRPRLAVVDDHGRALAAGRDWATVEAATHARVRLETGATAVHLGAAKLWQEGRRQRERPALEETLADLLRSPPERLAEVLPALLEQPESVVLGDLAGVPVVAWPGLRREGPRGVAARLFEDRGQAERATRAGLVVLLELAVSRELAWLSRDLAQELRRVALLWAPLGAPDELLRQTEDALRAHLTEVAGPVLPVRASDFARRWAEARQRARGLAPAVVDVLEDALQRRQALAAQAKDLPWLGAELARLAGADCVNRFGWPGLRQVPRYLEALKRRAERARLNAPKDAEKAALVAPFAKALVDLEKLCLRTGAPFAHLDEVAALLEEYRVSVFAQEMGTACPVSPKRLEGALAGARAALAGAAAV